MNHLQPVNPTPPFGMNGTGCDTHVSLKQGVNVQ